MEEKIKKLYENINFIGFYSTYHKDNCYIEKAMGLFEEIQEFTQWFLAGNQFGIEEEIYESLKENLLGIVKDCITAAKERDRVLMMDALEQGLSEYLKMFLPEDYIESGEI